MAGKNLISKQHRNIMVARPPRPDEGNDSDVRYWMVDGILYEGVKYKNRWWTRQYERSAVSMADDINLNNVLIQDDFISGTNVDGQIGELGWIVTDLGSYMTAISNNSPGVYRSFAHPATQDTYRYMRASSGRHILPRQIKRSVWRIKSLDPDPNQCWVIGFIYNHSAITEPEEGIYFVSSDSYADTNWRAITNNSSTTTTITAQVRDTNWHTFEILVNSDASQITFKIDGTIVAVHTTNITTNYIYPFAFKAKTPGFTGYTDGYLYIDYFGIVLTRDMRLEGGEIW